MIDHVVSATLIIGSAMGAYYIGRREGRSEAHGSSDAVLDKMDDAFRDGYDHGVEAAAKWVAHGNCPTDLIEEIRRLKGGTR
jgi:hypothetical protein